MTRSMFDFIGRTNALLENVDSHEEWMGHLDNVRDTRAKAMADYTTQISTEFDDRAKAVAARAHSTIQENYNAGGISVVPIDRVNYPKKAGLSGPFRYRTGEVLYFDYKNRAYFDPNERRNLSMQEAREKMGIKLGMYEDENRSDSEVAVFFDDRQMALSAYQIAQELGLKRGEVTYDPTIDPRYGVGRYAVRLGSHVQATKPEAFYGFLESLYDHVVEEDIDQFEWLLSEAVKEKSKFGGVSNKDAKAAGNPLHDKEGVWAADRDLPVGTFSRTRREKGLRLKARDKRTKDGRLQFVATKQACGRGARTPRANYNDNSGTAYGSKDYGRRCWDGKIPAWAAKGSKVEK
jgi:hypothetical protein